MAGPVKPVGEGGEKMMKRHRKRQRDGLIRPLETVPGERERSDSFN